MVLYKTTEQRYNAQYLAKCCVVVPICRLGSAVLLHFPDGIPPSMKSWRGPLVCPKTKRRLHTRALVEWTGNHFVAWVKHINGECHFTTLGCVPLTTVHSM